jgi:predicted AAA+ superfamily ATPase
MEHLISIYHDLLAKTHMDFVRYLYTRINWDARLVGITGARGTGKTTMLLQRIRLAGLKDQSLFISADHLYFSNHTLYDLANRFYQYGGKYLFIDEVHKYNPWSQEIKNMYDSFPDLHIVFTGSSILDLHKGFGDLSRRLLSYELKGLSFREYLSLELGLELQPLVMDEILNHRLSAEIPKPLMHFKEYLHHGYYPFYREDDYSIRLNAIINVVLEVDIPKYFDLRLPTVNKLKQLMQIISESVPFKPNQSKLAQLLEVSRTVLPEYLSYLEKARLLMQLRSDTQGLRALGKVQKVYLDNPNLAFALSPQLANTGTIRETFFLNQAGMSGKLTQPESGDFRLEKYTFEIGGPNKTARQIHHLADSFVVRDDIEKGFGKVVPLWMFGFLY